MDQAKNIMNVVVKSRKAVNQCASTGFNRNDNGKCLANSVDPRQIFLLS